MKFGVTVTRRRPPPVDEYGDPGTPSVDVVIEDVGVAPRQGAGIGEPDQRGRDGVVVGLTLYIRSTPDVRHQDQIVIPFGHVYAGVWEVEGEPGFWASPISGWNPGCTVQVKRSAG